jgi:hypothetical protein
MSIFLSIVMLPEVGDIYQSLGQVERVLAVRGQREVATGERRLVRQSGLDS